MEDQLATLLKGLKEIEESQKGAGGGDPGGHAESQGRPDPPHGWIRPASMPAKMPETRPVHGGKNVTVWRRTGELRVDPLKKVSVGDVMRQRDYGRDPFSDAD